MTFPMPPSSPPPFGTPPTAPPAPGPAVGSYPVAPQPPTVYPGTPVTFGAPPVRARRWSGSVIGPVGFTVAVAAILALIVVGQLAGTDAVIASRLVIALVGLVYIVGRNVSRT